MDMSLLLLILFAAAGTGLVISARTRSAQIARMARLNGCQYDREKDTVTTELTAGRLEFFTLYFHQYQHVCTSSDNLAFFRTADDLIYLNDNPKTKPVKYTIFTAELKTRQFPALKIAPLNSLFAPSQYALMKTNIPQVDAAYRIHAPSPASALVLTPYLIGLLKTRQNIYLELNDNALVYHENCLHPVHDLEIFRFRAMQILHELENVLVKLAATDTTATATLTPRPTDEAEARAEAMLKALCAEKPNAEDSSSVGGFRGVWLFVLLVLLIGISLFSWVALHNWIAR